MNEQLYGHECGLCTGLLPKNRHKQVYIGEVAYAMIPWEPLKEGHVMVLPKRHLTLESLTRAELVELRDITVMMKDKLKVLYPAAPPYLLSAMDTRYASIPEHFHYHLFPLERHIRTALAQYDSALGQRWRASPSELERMAQRLRPEKMAGEDVGGKHKKGIKQQ